MIELPKSVQLSHDLMYCKQRVAEKVPEPDRSFVLASLGACEAELSTMQRLEHNNTGLIEQIRKLHEFIDLMERQLALLQETLKVLEGKRHE